MKKFHHLFYILCIYAFLYLPIAILIVYSFNNARFSAVWHGFTLSWFVLLFHDANLLRITRNSLMLATLAATISVVVGAVGAVALYRYKFLGKSILNGIIFVLIIVPDLVFGISLLTFYAASQVSLGFFTLLIAHITFCIPFVVVTMIGRLHGTDKRIFEAAKDLGASEFTVFYKIILPLMMPALIAGWLLSFTLSLDDVVISYFVTGPSFQILPLYIFSQVRIGITPEIHALCSLMFVVTILLVILAQCFIMGKRGNIKPKLMKMKVS